MAVLTVFDPSQGPSRRSYVGPAPATADVAVAALAEIDPTHRTPSPQDLLPLSLRVLFCAFCGNPRGSFASMSYSEDAYECRRNGGFGRYPAAPLMPSAVNAPPSDVGVL